MNFREVLKKVFDRKTALDNHGRTLQRAAVRVRLKEMKQTLGQYQGVNTGLVDEGQPDAICEREWRDGSWYLIGPGGAGRRLSDQELFREAAPKKRPRRDAM